MPHAAQDLSVVYSTAWSSKNLRPGSLGMWRRYGPYIRGVPRTLAQRARFRDPDAVAGGTWEALDRVLRKAGYSEGLVKTVTARLVAEHMDPQRNLSHSFQVFRDGLRCLAGVEP